MQAQILVIFGASGDLAQRKLLPALCSLYAGKSLAKDFLVLGVSRTAKTDDSWRAEIKSSLHDKPAIDEFVKNIFYQQIDTANPNEYSVLSEKIKVLLKGREMPANVVFYLAVPPHLSAQIPSWLAAQGLNNQEDGFKRLVLEKPFGHDLPSAKKLNMDLLEHWQEEQIYRIDHYLGKETVQNLLVFRFANEIFDAMWNHRFVDYVEITAAETLGVENRSGYFDSSGSTRDMLQNHLLQVLAMVAMDPPLSYDAESVRNETMKIFKSLRPFNQYDLENNVVFGQYIGAKVKGEQIKAYREENGVPKDSRTETFVALKAYIDHYRWNNVPFYLRTGKRLPTRVTEIVIHFKPTPHPAFVGNPSGVIGNNQLVIRIQPDEGILLKIGLKEPGSGFKVKTVNMDFHYKDLSHIRVPDSYERLLMDAMLGDATLYALGQAVEYCWEFVDPILHYKEAEAKIWGYSAGTWGPLLADELMARDGRQWRYPCKCLTSDGETCEL